MEQRFLVEQPWKRIREYETFCFYHCDAGWGEDGIGIPERAAPRKGAWGAHGGQWEGFELG